MDGKDIGGLEIRTGDLGGKATTKEVGEAVCQALEKILQGKSIGGSGELGENMTSPVTEQHNDENAAWEKRLKHENVSTGPKEALALLM